MVTLIIFPIDIVDSGSMTVTGTMLSKGNRSPKAQRFSYLLGAWIIAIQSD